MKFTIQNSSEIPQEILALTHTGELRVCGKIVKTYDEVLDVVRQYAAIGKKDISDEDILLGAESHFEESKDE